MNQARARYARRRPRRGIFDARRRVTWPHRRRADRGAPASVQRVGARRPEPKTRPRAAIVQSEVAPGDFAPGAVRLELDVAAPVRLCLLGVPRLLERHCQVEIGVGKLRVRLQGALKQRD